jgi:hypothetical protein
MVRQARYNINSANAREISMAQRVSPPAVISLNERIAIVLLLFCYCFDEFYLFLESRCNIVL